MPINLNNENNSVMWDSIATYFSQKDKHNLTYAPGTDNYETVWPVLSEIIKNHLKLKENSAEKVFDFGCGTGILAEKMHQIGFNVFACDISKEMIDLAYLHTTGGVSYKVGSFETLQSHSPYKLVTSIMVFQFIPDLEPVIKAIDRCLDKNGFLFFAVHANEYINECIRYGIKFRINDDKELPIEGEISIGDTWIKTYIRNAEWYDNLLCSKGFTRIYYSLEGVISPTSISNDNINWYSAKYYVACYQKKNNK